jgi:hypothetical protein
MKILYWRHENSVLARRDPTARARRSFVTGKCYWVTTFSLLNFSRFFMKQPLQTIVRNLGEDTFGACSRIGTWRENLDYDQLKNYDLSPTKKQKVLEENWEQENRMNSGRLWVAHSGSGTKAPPLAACPNRVRVDYTSIPQYLRTWSVPCVNCGSSVRFVPGTSRSPSSISRFSSSQMRPTRVGVSPSGFLFFSFFFQKNKCCFA